MRSSVNRLPRIHLGEEKLKDLLRNMGVTVVAETETDLLCYCCFHHNVDSPAFNMEKASPYRWKCWNGKCNKKGNIFSFLTQKGYTKNEAKKMLLKGAIEISDLEALIDEMLSEPEELENPWASVDPNRFAQDDELHNGPARAYAEERGITERAFSYFKMGYSPKRNMLVVPAFNVRSEFVGVIGRSIEGKQYRYSAGLQRGEVVWNANNVAERSDSIILTEGSLDSVYIWQAGWENVGAVLGSAISPKQWTIIRSHFNEIICFFDNDEPGLNLTESIVKNVKDLAVSVVVYPDERKDPGELTADEIRSMLNNRVTSIEILLHGL